MSVIQDKKYVDKDDHKRFRPTDLGKMVNDLLVAHFPEVLDVAFTAKMEGELDDVEVGKLSWRKALGDFYGPFTKALELAKVEMKDVKRQEILTDIVCEKCGSPMIIKFGRNGEFLACRTYPECKNTKEFRRSNEGKIEVQAAETTDEVCEKCQSPMVVKSGRFGKFLACSAYPACKTTKAISLGINCPLCAKGISARTSKRGKMFYGCTGYPNCKFASWDKPVNEPCPQCEGKYLVEKVTKSRGTEIRCPEEGCGYTRVGG
jgi:DNA topoisomerase-1